MSRRMGWVRHVVRIWKERNKYRIFVGKPERNRPLGRHRYRWEDKIKIDRGEIG
jgi:hypothetical protein